MQIINQLFLCTIILHGRGNHHIDPGLHRLQLVVACVDVDPTHIHMRYLLLHASRLRVEAQHCTARSTHMRSRVVGATNAMHV